MNGLTRNEIRTRLNLPKGKRLSSKFTSILRKPQAQFSVFVKEKVKNQLIEWLESNGIEGKDAEDCAACYVSQAIAQYRSKISVSAPDVIFSDAHKTEIIFLDALELIHSDNETDQIQDSVDAWQEAQDLIHGI